MKIGKTAAALLAGVAILAGCGSSGPPPQRTAYQLLRDIPECKGNAITSTGPVVPYMKADDTCETRPWTIEIQTFSNQAQINRWPSEGVNNPDGAAPWDLSGPYWIASVQADLPTEPEILIVQRHVGGKQLNG